MATPPASGVFFECDFPSEVWSNRPKEGAIRINRAVSVILAKADIKKINRYFSA